MSNATRFVVAVVVSMLGAAPAALAEDTASERAITMSDGAALAGAVSDRDVQPVARAGVGRQAAMQGALELTAYRADPSSDPNAWPLRPAATSHRIGKSSEYDASVDYGVAPSAWPPRSASELQRNLQSGDHRAINNTVDGSFGP